MIIIQIIFYALCFSHFGTSNLECSGDRMYQALKLLKEIKLIA